MHSGEALVLALFGLASLPLGFVLGWLARLQGASRSECAADGAEKVTPATVDTQVILQHAETAFRSFCDVTDGLHHDVGLHGEKLAAATTSLHKESKDVERVVSRIVEANAWLQDQLVTAQKTIREQALELERRMTEANSDCLTGIANRRAFDMELQRQLARWQRYGSMFTLVLIDIDHFKSVNDQYGHLGGDAVLRATAELLTSNLREVDFAARFGGEEFAVLLCETDHHTALVVADRLRKTIAAAQIPWEGQQLSITVSVGVAALSRFDDVEAVIKRADEALYVAKREGRNRTALASYTPKPGELASPPEIDSTHEATPEETEELELVPLGDES
jgi:diguanylate cyclase